MTNAINPHEDELTMKKVAAPLKASSPSTLKRRTPGLLPLEQRFMFDGAAVADASQTLVDARAEIQLSAVTANLAFVEQSARSKAVEFLNNSTDQELFAIFNGAQAAPDAEWSQRLSDIKATLGKAESPFEMRLMDRASQLTAVAAFTADGPGGKPTIFVNPYWMGLLDNQDLANVMVEEVGHWIDNALNLNRDSPNDEGEIFAAKVNGFDATSGNETQNDTGWVVVDGSSYQVEFASFSFTTAYQIVVDINDSTTVNLTTGFDSRQALNSNASVSPNQTYEFSIDKESNTHNFIYTPNGLGAVTISDGTNGNSFSGNDVSAIGLNIAGTDYYGWISRPIKVGGQVKGFYFWTDSRFIDLSTAQADGNQDGDASVLNNRGFVLVVDKTYFDSSLTYISRAGVQANTYKVIGSSSDRVDSALNSLIPTVKPPIANSDTTDDSLLNQAGGSAKEAGGLSNTNAGYDAFGNVLTNDVNQNSSGTKSLVSASSSNTAKTTVSATGDASAINGTQFTGAYGTLRISNNGSYYYTVDNTKSAVQALRLTTNTLSDIFTYTMTDSTSGATSTTTLTIRIVGANDTPVTVDDYNIAKESLTSALSSGTNYDANDPLGVKATGNVLPNDNDVDAGDQKYVSGITATANGISPAGSTTTISITSGTLQTSWNNDYLVYNGSILKSGGVNIQVSVDTANSTISFTGTFDNPPPSGATLSLYQTTNLNVSSLHGSVVMSQASNRVASSTVNVSSIVGTLSVGMRVTGGTIPVTDNTIIRSVDRLNGTVVLEDATTHVLKSYLFNSSTSLSFSLDAGSTLTGKYGTLVLNENGTYVYTPTKDNTALQDGQSAVESFNYTMRDSGGLTSQATLYINVLGSGVNDPHATDDSANGAPGASGGAAVEAGGVSNGTSGYDAVGNLLTNDTSPAGTNVVVSATKDGSPVTPTTGVIHLTGSYGDLYIYTIAGTYTTGSYSSVARAAGEYLYIVNNSNATIEALNAGGTITESFRYRIENGQTSSESGASLNLFDIATLTVTINGANDNPVATNDGATAIEAGGTDNTTPGFDPNGNVINNDSDIDNTQAQLNVASVRTGNIEGSGISGTLSGSTITLAGTYGTLSMNTDGSWTYIVDNNNSTVNALSSGQTLTENFNYTLTDGTLTDIAVLAITINGSNDAISVNNITVNEGSPYAVFTVLGVNGTGVSLSLDNGSSNPTTGLTGYALQYWDPTSGASGAWVNYTANSTLTIGPTNQLLVRTSFSLEKETDFDPNETFTLTATPTSGSAVVGTATIKDDGTGTYYNDSSPLPNGNPEIDPNHALDDDRQLVVHDVTANEGDGTNYAVFSIDTVAGQTLNLTLTDGTAVRTGTGATLDFGSTLQYWDPTSGASGAWVNYSAGFTVPGTSNANTTLLVRVLLNSDNSFENSETFDLTATYVVAGKTDSGTATIKDDGTGTKFTGGNPTGTTPASSTSSLDDDRGITVSGLDDVSEGSNTIFTVTLPDGNNRNTEISLILSNGIASNDDYSATFTAYYFNGSTQVILSITDGNIILPTGVTSFYVSVPTTQDTKLEGSEDFSLTATIVGGKSASDTSTILDDGTGKIYDEKGLNPSGPGDDDNPTASPPTTPPLPPATPAQPPVITPLPLPAPPAVVFSSTLTPLAPTLVPVDPPRPLGDAVTSGSGYQIPVSETAPPGLTLYQGVTDQFVQSTNTVSRVSLPFDAFIHSNKDAVIKLDAKLADDSKLPNWVQFDQTSGTFQVTPPASFKGKIDIKVVARDDDGREATAIFQMFIGEQSLPSQGPQSRESFSDKLRMANKRSLTLVKVGDAISVKPALPHREITATQRARVG